MRATPIFALIGFLICLPTQAEQNLVDALGKYASIIHKDNIAKIAVLEVIGAETAQQNALKKENTIAGYPIAQSLPLISDEKSEAIVSLLLDEKNYSDRMRRCVNSSFYGMRFKHDHHIVEFALGTPCNQVLVVFNHKDSRQRWGKVMTAKAANTIIKALTR